MSPSCACSSTTLGSPADSARTLRSRQVVSSSISGRCPTFGYGLLAYWLGRWLGSESNVVSQPVQRKPRLPRHAVPPKLRDTQTTSAAQKPQEPRASRNGVAVLLARISWPLDHSIRYSHIDPSAVARSTLLARSDARRHGPDWVLSASGHSGMAKATCKALQSHGTWSELDCERPQDIRGGINFALEGFGSDCHLLRLLPSFVFASEICPDPMIPHACWCLQALVRAARGARGHRTGPGAGPVCCMTI